MPANSVKQFLPSPIRSFPWRYRWISEMQACRAAPLACLGKLVRWTLFELMNRDVVFNTAEGNSLRSMSRNFTSLAVYLTGKRDPELQAFIAKRLRPGANFLDVGANIGVYSIFASALVQSTGRVVSIEANPVTFSYLKENISRNRLDNVLALNCAAGDAPGTIRMTHDSANAGQAHVSAHGEDGASVPVEVLDELMSLHGIDRIDYMKIDVEGFELPVLRGSRSLIRKNPNIIIQIELVPEHARRYGYKIDDIVDLLVDLGLKPYCADAQGDIVPLMNSEIAAHSDVIWMR